MRLPDPPVPGKSEAALNTIRTIRNCLPTFQFVCPKRWEELTVGDDPAVRHCSQCDRQVYFCATDDETVAHAMAGHCIARERPADSERPRVTIGQPSHPPRVTVTPKQQEAGRLIQRERGIDDSIRTAQTSTRFCPHCRYPATDWRVTCRVCGFVMGRAIGGSTQS
jgi:hypothetical protein